MITRRGLLSSVFAPVCFAADRPNIVLLIAAELGGAEVSRVATPHILGIADRGIQFGVAYAAACVGSPAQAALITGRYPARFGHEREPVGRQMQYRGAALPATEVTLAERLRDAGYQTILADWRLTHEALSAGWMRRGFDTSPMWPGNSLRVGLRRPFFLQGMLPSGIAADVHAGEVVSHLREVDFEHDTLLIFLGAHGPTLTLDDRHRNAPLRGQRGQLYEGGVRVPFVLQWPSRVAHGQTFAHAVSAVDVVPTLLSAASLPLPEELDGTDLLAQAAPRSLYWRYRRAKALRRGEWKLIQPTPPDGPDRPWELYDLAHDPGEHNNLAGTRPAVVASLVSAWREINAGMCAPAWGRV